MLLTGTLGDLTGAISTLGFPIVVCVALFYYIWTECKANRRQIGKLADALNNNTLVISKLLERMDKD